MVQLVRHSDPNAVETQCAIENRVSSLVSRVLGSQRENRD